MTTDSVVAANNPATNSSVTTSSVVAATTSSVGAATNSTTATIIWNGQTGEFTVSSGPEQTGQIIDGMVGKYMQPHFHWKVIRDIGLDREALGKTTNDELLRRFRTSGHRETLAMIFRIIMRNKCRILACKCVTPQTRSDCHWRMAGEEALYTAADMPAQIFELTISPNDPDVSNRNRALVYITGTSEVPQSNGLDVLVITGLCECHPESGYYFLN